MNKLEKLKLAVASLPEQEYRKFHRWFLDKDWEKRKEQIEKDDEEPG